MRRGYEFNCEGRGRQAKREEAFGQAKHAEQAKAGCEDQNAQAYR